MNKLSSWKALVALALAFTCSFTSGVRAEAAQDAARLAGVVLDESGGVLPGVTVAVTAEAGPAEPLVTVTDAEGAFLFDDLGPGQYTLVLSLPGFQEKRQSILLRAGESTVQRWALALATLSEVVHVVAEAVVMDQRLPAGEAHVEDRILTAVPLAKERFEDALPLLPSTIRGPDGLLNMNGTRANQSALLVNGVNGTDPVTGQFAVRL
ncbi:MAG: carboxypeptidase regulatory-like domain-containing protein, partial [Acidobacteria bacterium]|nr:carboxypeptidase regulatory-like domain-containing protein [Acidobacteriota bacterium]